MHIRDGILSPEVCLMGGALAIAAVGFSLRRLRSQLTDRAVPLTGMLAAVLFAGQMVNFPLFGLPVSGHLLGGVLAAVILGPWAGCIALTLVLAVQAVLFADGGLLSLGVNVLNMAVVGCWGGGACYATLRRLIGGNARATVLAAVMAAYLSVLAAAGLFCVEFAASHRTAVFDLRQIAVWMLLYHALIGVGEAAITGALLAFLLARRPEILHRPAAKSAPHWRALTIGGGVSACLIAMFGAPLASGWPDGLDAVAQRIGFEPLAVDQPLLFAEYAIPLPSGWDVASVSLAGLLGTIVVLLLGWRLSRWLDPAPPALMESAPPR